MGRPKTLRTMIARIADRQLKSLWDLRCCTRSAPKQDRMLIREAIRDRIHKIRLNRSEAKLISILEGKGNSERLKKMSQEAMKSEAIEKRMQDLHYEEYDDMPCNPWARRSDD